MDLESLLSPVTNHVLTRVNSRGRNDCNASLNRPTGDEDLQHHRAAVVHASHGVPHRHGPVVYAPHDEFPVGEVDQQFASSGEERNEVVDYIDDSDITSDYSVIDSDDGNDHADGIDDVVDIAQWLEGQQRTRTRRPTNYTWSLVGDYSTYDEAKDRVAPSAVTFSTTDKCTTCVGTDLHKMRTRYLKCTCRAECTKRMKILECVHASRRGRSFVYKRGDYAPCRAPPAQAMTRRIRNLADWYLCNGNTPSRTQFCLQEFVEYEDMPSLKKFQSRCSHLKATRLNEHNMPSKMAEMLLKTAFRPQPHEVRFIEDARRRNEPQPNFVPWTQHAHHDAQQGGFHDTVYGRRSPPQSNVWQAGSYQGLYDGPTNLTNYGPRVGDRSDPPFVWQQDPRGGDRSDQPFVWQQDPRGGDRNDLPFVWHQDPRGGDRNDLPFVWHQDPRGGDHNDPPLVWHQDPRGGDRNDPPFVWHQDPRGGDRSGPPFVTHQGNPVPQLGTQLGNPQTIDWHESNFQNNLFGHRRQTSQSGYQDSNYGPPIANRDVGYETSSNAPRNSSPSGRRNDAMASRTYRNGPQVNYGHPTNFGPATNLPPPFPNPSGPPNSNDWHQAGYQGSQLAPPSRPSPGNQAGPPNSQTSCGPSQQETHFFSFGFAIVNGAPQVGYGGDSGVFRVGITTRRMLRRLDCDPWTFVFHWDATYKTNSLGYPLLICGITDPSGRFHPIAFFLLSEETTEDYDWAMKELMAVYEAVVGRPLQLYYVMADAARAPVAAVKGLPRLNVKKILMCFYHCVACVHKKLAGVSKTTKALVARHMFRIHYSRSHDESQRNWAAAMTAWTACQELVAKDFVRYFDVQWMTGDCCNWQIYHTPTGFPTTNNPCELFNKHLKGTYTQRRLSGICATFKMLGDIAEQYATYKELPFAHEVDPRPRVVQRFKRLKKEGLLQRPPHSEPLQAGCVRILGVVPAEAIALAFAFEDDARTNDVSAALDEQGITTMHQGKLAQAIAYYFKETTNNVRHESISAGRTQPSNGWIVCTTPGALACECNYFFKWKYCCHLLYALDIEGKDTKGADLPPKTFVRNKAPRRQSRPQFTGQRPALQNGGRNVRQRRTVGPPLSLV